jgi:hypothetical protein
LETEWFTEEMNFSNAQFQPSEFASVFQHLESRQQQQQQQSHSIMSPADLTPEDLQQMMSNYASNMGSSSALQQFLSNNNNSQHNLDSVGELFDSSSSLFDKSGFDFSDIGVELQPQQSYQKPPNQTDLFRRTFGSDFNLQQQKRQKLPQQSGFQNNPFLHGRAKDPASMLESSNLPRSYSAPARGGFKRSADMMQQGTQQNASWGILAPKNRQNDAMAVPDFLAAPVDVDLFDDYQPIPLDEILSGEESGQKKVKQTQQGQAPPLVKAEPPKPSLLHQACNVYPKTLAVVSSALNVEPESIRRRVPTPTIKALMAHSTLKALGMLHKRQKDIELYTLPLHIALNRHASLDVIQALVNAGPDVIGMMDGPDGCTAISIAISKHCDFDVISLLVKTRPEALEIVDRRQNSSLHTACVAGAKLNVIKLLVSTFVGAMTMRNINGETPLVVAEKTHVCPIDVIDYLHELVSDELEERADHLDDDLDLADF